MQARLHNGERQRALQLLEAALANSKTEEQRQMWESLRRRHFSEAPTDDTP